MKYTVILGWKEEYEFDDGTTALNYAEIAAAHSTDPERKVQIEIVPDKDIEDDVIAAVIDDVAAELEASDE